MKTKTLLLTASLGLAAASGAWAQGILADNLGNTSAGSGMALGSSWNAAKFTSDGQSYSLKSVTLLMRAIPGSEAQLDIYSDSGADKPAAALGTMTSPGGFASSLTPAVFTSTGISLAANSSYWVVLKAPVGGLGWSYTHDVSGSGPGFSTSWSSTLDGGATWATEIYPPYQMKVSVDAVPEPQTWALFGLGLGGLLFRQRRTKAQSS